MPILPRNLKRHFAEGGKAINAWCSIPSPLTAEVIARQGFDTVSVDLQHGMIDFQTAFEMLQAINNVNVATLCRVPWNEPSIIMKVLDAGFTGVICPMINSKEEAKRFAAACLYAPDGIRSYGPTRAVHAYGADYQETAREYISSFAMIETREALNNVDDILSVEEVDGLYIGPADLSLSMGYKPSLLSSDKEVVDAIATIQKSTKGAGKICAIHCGSPEMVSEMLDRGFDLASLVTDLRIFTLALQSQLAEARRPLNR